jgi:hypothetical protein
MRSWLPLSVTQFSPRLVPLHQVIDDAPAIRAAIDKVAQMDDGGLAVARLAAVFGDQIMRAQEQVEMAVNVAYGVAAHHACPLCGWTPGGFHTPRTPRGIFVNG